MDKTKNKSVHIIGARLDLGAEDLGAYDGAPVIRERGLIQKLHAAGLQIEDSGDVAAQKRELLTITDPSLPYIEEIVRVNQEIAQLTHEYIQIGGVPVVIGGDHSVNLGAFSGASAVLGSENIGMIYIDAHGDMNTPEMSESHNIHGMHLASLMGFGPDVMVNIHAEGTKLKTNNLLHIAGSDFDDFELDLIKDKNLHAVTMFDILNQGMGAVIAAIDTLMQQVDHVWVSLDLDAIDWVYAPGVGIPNQGGLTYREIAFICDYVGKKCNVVGLDVVEYNPKMDQDFKTAELSIDLIARLLGKKYSWYTNYMSRQR